MSSRYQTSTYTPSLRPSGKGKHSHTQQDSAARRSSMASPPSTSHKWYEFLLPSEEAQSPSRLYDAPLRRGLFSHAKPGNEETVAGRRASVQSESSERRRSSLASVFALRH